MNIATARNYLRSLSILFSRKSVKGPSVIYPATDDKRLLLKCMKKMFFESDQIETYVRRTEIMGH